MNMWPTEWVAVLSGLRERTWWPQPVLHGTTIRKARPCSALRCFEAFSLLCAGSDVARQGDKHHTILETIELSDVPLLQWLLPAWCLAASRGTKESDDEFNYEACLSGGAGDGSGKKGV